MEAFHPRAGPGPREAFARALTRAAALPRWWATSVVLASILLAMPFYTWDSRAFGALSVGGVEVGALLGVGAGWIVFDRLASARVPGVLMTVTLVALAGGGWLAWGAAQALGVGLVQGPEIVLAVSLVFGGLIRGFTAGLRSMTSLVVVAAVTTWLTYDLWKVPYLPLRDIHLYLGAGATAASGASPYLTAPLTAMPALVKLPFVYPPLTIPLFEVLAGLPRPIVESLWVGGSILAVAAALWLLGIRGRWLVVLVAWPPLAQGIGVGNVASYTFFLFALGFRVGAAILFSGIFKVQSMIPVLWLVRQRRWREITVGVALVAILAVISIPIVGQQTWLNWPGGLSAFQQTVARFPSLQSLALERRFGAILGLAFTIVAVGLALRGRGRNGLGRFGLASVIGSPTLYLHGLSPILAGALVLGPELLWFLLGLGPWSPGLLFRVLRPAWIAMGMVGLALLLARDDDLRLPQDLSPARADLHPAGATGQVWPD